MTDKVWSERLQYLTELKDALEKSEVGSSCAEVVDSLLTCCFPIHRRVVGLLAEIIANVVIKNPEVLSAFLAEILKFVFFGLRLGGGKDTMKSLIGVLYLEVDPNLIVNTAILVEKAEPRPLHIESVLTKWFPIESKIELEKQTYMNLMCFLVHDAYPEAKKLMDTMGRYYSNVRQILTVASRNQPAYFREFVEAQPVDTQLVLEPYITEERKFNRSSAPKEEFTETELDTEEAPIKTIRVECRKGVSANLAVLAAAYPKVQVNGVNHAKAMFKDLIKFLSILPRETVHDHTEELRKICCSIFNSPELLDLVKSSEMTVEMTQGLSVFVWNCQEKVLKGADALYRPLYKLFKKAPGQLRSSIVAVVMAIERVTGVQFDSMEFIPVAHRKLIYQLKSEYEADQD